MGTGGWKQAAVPELLGIERFVRHPLFEDFNRAWRIQKRITK